MTTQHTSGPWAVGLYGVSERAVIKCGAKTIATIGYVDDGESNLHTHANARLIAAAPELLEALQAMLADASVGHGVPSFTALDMAKQAIAKAKGQ